MKNICECGCGNAAKRTFPERGHVKGQPTRFCRGHRTTQNALRHGASIGYGTPEYKAFCHAKSRCNNPNTKDWKNYGGRGIKFLFTSFEQFKSELGPRPTGMSLDRFPDNDGNYEPGNVKWSTMKEQRFNQRVPVERLSDEKLLAECRKRGIL